MGVYPSVNSYMIGATITLNEVEQRLYYALMVGQFPTYAYKGAMAGNELIKKERIEPFGSGTAYIARQNELIEL